VKITKENLNKIIKKCMKEVLNEMLGGYFPARHDLPDDLNHLSVPEGGTEVTDAQEKTRNFLSTKAYTSMNDQGRTQWLKNNIDNFVQFVIDGEIHHIFGDYIFNSQDEDVDFPIGETLDNIYMPPQKKEKNKQ
jgi:hypothetical protein